MPLHRMSLYWWNFLFLLLWCSREFVWPTYGNHLSSPWCSHVTWPAAHSNPPTSLEIGIEHHKNLTHTRTYCVPFAQYNFTQAAGTWLEDGRGRPLGVQKATHFLLRKFDFGPTSWWFWAEELSNFWLTFATKKHSDMNNVVLWWM